MGFWGWVAGLVVAMVVVGWAVGLNAGAVAEAGDDHGGHGGHGGGHH